MKSGLKTTILAVSSFLSVLEIPLSMADIFLFCFVSLSYLVLVSILTLLSVLLILEKRKYMNLLFPVHICWVPAISDGKGIFDTTLPIFSMEFIEKVADF